MVRIPKKTKKMLQIESEYGVLIEDLLRKLYVDDELTTTQIGEMFEMPQKTIFFWLQSAKIYSGKLDIWS